MFNLSVITVPASFAVSSMLKLILETNSLSSSLAPRLLIKFVTVSLARNPLNKSPGLTYIPRPSSFSGSKNNSRMVSTKVSLSTDVFLILKSYLLPHSILRIIKGNIYKLHNLVILKCVLVLLWA